METNRKHFSIKLIYWITQVAFWLFVIAGLLIIGIGFGLIFNLFNTDLNLHVGLPVAFDAVEQGNLQMMSKSIGVEFKEAYGKIGFNELPAFIGRIYGIFMLIVAGIFFYIFKVFRQFISNVYYGKVFENQNFRLLNQMGYGLLIFWVIIFAYSVSQNFLIARHLTFETLQYAGNLQLNFEVAFAGLIIIMLSHIFSYGAKLREDNELTI